MLHCDRCLPRFCTEAFLAVSDSGADNYGLPCMGCIASFSASSARRQGWVHGDLPLFFHVQVCRSAGYYEHALAVSQAANEPEWYLDILLEDCQQYDEALAYLQKLPRQQAAAALTRHGKVGGRSSQDYFVWQEKNMCCSACTQICTHMLYTSAAFSVECLRCLIHSGPDEDLDVRSSTCFTWSLRDAPEVQSTDLSIVLPCSP